MRSMISFAALIAAIGFSGCCGTGASSPLSAHGCKLSGLGQKAVSATAMTASPASYTSAAECGCGGGACGGEGMMEYVPAAGDCGCGSPSGVQADSSAAACACGEGAVVSVSQPYSCGGGDANANAQVAPAGAADCGCSAAPVVAMPTSGSDCGCSSCGDAVPVVTPMQISAPPADSGCSACQGAAVEAPVQGRGLVSGKGMGMMMNDRGLACADGSARQGLCERKRSLKPEKPAKQKKTLAQRFGLGKSKSVVKTPAAIELVSNDLAQECVECSGAVAGGAAAVANEVSGRHISHGVIADVRNATRGNFGDTAATVAQPAPVGHFGGHRSCGVAGCGHGGRLCGGCNKLRNLAGIGSGNPYGGAIPHTAQQPGQSGLAPAYAYPYYTTRGPRDFLRDNPPSIGR